jgi:hypothetical protein
MDETEAGAVNLIYASITCDEIIPAGGSIEVDISSGGSSLTTDPYYFTIIRGVGVYFHYTVFGSTYTIEDFLVISASTSIDLAIPVVNPSTAGSTMTISASVYDDLSNLMGTGSGSTPAVVSTYNTVYSPKFHRLEIISINNAL